MLYILLPIYNEGSNLKPLLRSLFSEFSSSEARIIAINDGSTDQSLDILRSELRDSDVVCSYAINMNIGVAFSEGFREFLLRSNDDDCLIIIESDQTSEANLVRDLYGMIRETKVDVVVASRYCDGGGYKRFPLHRRILSYGANYFMKIMFPIENVSEYSLFCRAYSRRIIDKLREEFGIQGIIQGRTFVSNAELLVKISFLTSQIIEFPAVYDYGKKKGRSKIPIFSTFLEYLTMVRTLYKIRNKLRNKQLSKIT